MSEELTYPSQQKEGGGINFTLNSADKNTRDKRNNNSSIMSINQQNSDTGVHMQDGFIALYASRIVSSDSTSVPVEILTKM